jgi:hypothetical protein
MAATITTSHATAAVSPKSYYPQILAAAENPDFRSKDFLRLVLMQMCVVCLELGEVAKHSSLAFKVGPLVAQIRTLRDLAATARLVSEFSIQNDALDLDGPKFTYVLGRIMAIFAESAQESNCGPLYCQTIMALFAKKIGEAEEDIRKNVKNVHEGLRSQKPFGRPDGSADSSAESMNNNQ